MSADPEKQIAILQRKVARERQARKTAEKVLEDYSTQIYMSNQALQRSLSKSQKRERDLEFLANTSASVASDRDVNELLRTTSELTANFSGAVCACYSLNDTGQFGENNQSLVRFDENDWRFEPLIYNKLLSFVPDVDTLLENWYIQDVSNKLNIFDIDCQWLVALNFKLPSDRIGWIVFVLNQEMLDEETLFVLDTAKSHIRAGLSRRVDRRKLEKKNRELKRAVLRLEKAQTQLIHSEKMASLGQLAAGVAHEINNPIGFILSNQRVMKDYVTALQSVLKSINDKLNSNQVIDNQWLNSLFSENEVNFIVEDLEALAKDNEDGAAKVSEIVNSLKHFSHSSDMEFKEVDITDCIHKALKVAANAMKSRREVKTEIPTELPIVNGNISQLQQVLINLLVNAAQATTASDSISIEVKFNDDNLSIAVSDTGSGMDERTLNRLFTPFFTTKDIGEGTGLGLSVSMGIIEGHGGTIEVDSEPGLGSTFTIILPVDAASVES